MSLTAKYWDQIPVVSTPVFTPASGNFSQSINVSITSSTLSSQIRYTINGSEPTESSPLYTGTLSLSSTTNLKAKAFKVGSISSSTTSSTYTKLLNVIPLADGVPISGVTGLTGTFQYFKIVVPDNQSKLDIKTIGLNGDCELYVKQGSLPTTSDNQFKSTLSGSNENLTVENPQAGEYFIMLFSQATYSGLQLTADYSLVKAGIPTITPTAGTYNLQANISMQTSTTGAQIRYTTDNSTPTANSTLYNATISLSSNSTIKAIAFKSNYLNSDVATASFTITNITTQALTNNAAITSISGAVNSEKHFYIDVPANQSFLTIKIFGGTGDCDLYVKKDGQATLESWQYRPFVDGNNESIIIPNPQAARYYIMLRGYAQYAGLNLQANYSSVLGQVATPVLTPPNGASAATMLVNISCQTPNAVVKYTEDGTTPNGNSTTYTQPISVSASKTIKAIAMLSGYTDSSIVAGNFTITATQTANLTFNVPKLANSGNVNSLTFYKLTIPSGISGSVVVKTLGGTGDCDLYIKQGSLPSLTSYDQRPYLAGNNEEVVLQNVLPDQVYYIMLHGLQSYSELPYRLLVLRYL